MVSDALLAKKKSVSGYNNPNMKFSVKQVDNL